MHDRGRETAYIRDHRSHGLSVAEGCRLMGLSRTTFYDQPRSAADDTAIVEAIAAICDEFEHYGWRRVRATLRQKGMIVNHKKIRRLMREHDLQPRMRRRFTVTTDSDHNQPIFPNLAPDIISDGPDQLWVPDIIYVTVVGGFAYVAVVLDAWSRRGVDDPLHAFGVGEEWDDLAPVAPPALRDRRISLPPVAGLEVLKGLHAGFGVLGPVDRAQRRHDGLAVLPGHELQGMCGAAIKVRVRIASSKMFLNVQPSPHISCSLPRGMSRGNYGTAEHGDTERNHSGPSARGSFIQTLVLPTSRPAGRNVHRCWFANRRC